MPSDDPPPRLYQLTRPDGVGFLRHWSGRQAVVGFSGLFLVLSGIRLLGTPALAITLFVIGGTLAIVGLGRTPSGEIVLDIVGPACAQLRDRLLRRNHWVAPFSILADGAGTAVPPLFGGIVLHELDPVVTFERPGLPFGVIEDRGDGSVSVVLRIHGSGFAVADSWDKDMRVARWGQALADFCRERHPVCRFTWTQWCAPAGIEEHRVWMREAMHADPDPSMVEAYEDVLERVGRAANRCETFVTLSIARSRVRLLPHHRGNRLVAAAERALDEADLLARQFRRADLVVTAPLPAGQIARAVRVRLDPSCLADLERRDRALGIAAGVVTPSNGFPLSIEESRSFIRCDGSLHRAFRVAEWPRTSVPADWMRDFLGLVGAVRMVTVVYHPQSRRQSRWEVDSQASRTDGAMDEKAEKHHRVGAELRRASAAIEQIDEELERGAGMEHFAGVVIVTASSVDELEYASERVVQGASNVGIELRRLDFRHGRALVAALPIGRGVREGMRA